MPAVRPSQGRGASAGLSAAHPSSPFSSGILEVLDRVVILAMTVGATATILVLTPFGQRPVIRLLLPLASALWLKAWLVAVGAWALGMIPRRLAGRLTPLDRMALKMLVVMGRLAFWLAGAGGRLLLRLLRALPVTRRAAERVARWYQAGLGRLDGSPPQQPALPPATALFPGGPPLDLLAAVDASVARAGDSAARGVRMALARLGMPEITVVGTQTGPTLSTVLVALPPGIRASQVRALADDLAAEMGVPAVTVRAAEGRGGVLQVQVPVRKRQAVPIRTVLESDDYRTAKGLPIPVGVEAAGEPVVFDLRDTPHLLVAGTTGAGKSVFMHAVLTGLIMRFGPDKLRLILIDPKRGVEMAVYTGLPHLLVPVVTDPAAAPQYLAWAVREMERRYDLLAQRGVRNIIAYNQVAADEGVPPLPYIVVAIDEAADLMMVAGDQVEESVVRLAQLARAAGIHLVIATQRPSKEVLTGLIRSNVPSRVAFRVAKQADSLIILDEGGAEKLLGQGDLLFKAVGAELIRAQSPFITAQEVESVVGWWRAWAQDHPEQDTPVIPVPPAAKSDGPPEEVQGTAPVAPQDRQAALRHRAEVYLLRTGRATVGDIQRALGIRRQTAVDLVRWLVEEGLLTPAQGRQPGECPLSPSERRERLAQLLGREANDVVLADAEESEGEDGAG